MDKYKDEKTNKTDMKNALTVADAPIASVTPIVANTPVALDRLLIGPLWN